MLAGVCQFSEHAIAPAKSTGVKPSISTLKSQIQNPKLARETQIAAEYASSTLSVVPEINCAASDTKNATVVANSA